MKATEDGQMLFGERGGDEPHKAMTTDSARDPRKSGTLCQGCGKRYRCDWMLPSDQWEMIRFGDNLLCGPCITERIEFELAEASMFLAFKVVEL